MEKVGEDCCFAGWFWVSCCSHIMFSQHRVARIFLTYGWTADVPFTWVSLLARVDRLLFEPTAEGQSCKKNSQIWKANRHIFEISMVQLESSFEASSLLNTSWFAGHRDLKPENFLLLDCPSCDAVCTVFGFIFFYWDSIPGSFCQFAWRKGDCPD